MTPSTTCSRRPSSAPRSAPPPRSCCDAAHRASARSRPCSAARAGPDVKRSPLGRPAPGGPARGGELCDRIPTDEIEESVRETVSEARDRIDGFVRSELQRPAPRAAPPAEAAWRLAPALPQLARIGGRICRRAGAARILLPATAHAWTPGTHVFLGEAVLRSLAQLPRCDRRPAPRVPVRFPVRIDRRRHEHREEVRARRPALPFVDRRAGDLTTRRRTSRCAPSASATWRISPPTPSRTTTSCPSSWRSPSSTSSLGHSYWESRFETHLGPACARRARDLILLDHSRSDGLLDRILSPTIFSTPTNRRIFRGMVLRRGHRIVAADLRADDGEQPLGSRRRRRRPRTSTRSYDFIIDLLVAFDRRRAVPLDPSGDEALRIAKQVRRAGAARRRTPNVVLEEAERRFGLAVDAARLSHSRCGEPLYDAEPRRQQLIELASDRRAPSTSSSRRRPAPPAASSRRRGSAPLRRASRRTLRRSSRPAARRRRP